MALNLMHTGTDTLNTRYNSLIGKVKIGLEYLLFQSGPVRTPLCALLSSPCMHIHCGVYLYRFHLFCAADGIKKLNLL